MKTILLQPGRYYHIFNRAKNGDPLFKSDEDYKFFLRLYKTHIAPVAETYAYCLLHDHLHLLVRIHEDAEGSLFKPFAVLFNAYAKGYNKQNGHEGRLFMFKLKRIEIRRETYILDMVRYINQNARRHGVTDDLSSYRFSSFRSTVSGTGDLVNRDEVIRHFGMGEMLIQNLLAPVDERAVKPFMMEQ